MEEENIRITEQRINQLRTYFDSVKLKQMETIRNEGYEPLDVQPHVGLKYDYLKYEKRPFRILIMGEETLKEKGYSIERRSAQILTEASLQIKDSNYMKGITLLLKFLFNDIFKFKMVDNEYIEEKTLFNHFFNYIALSNWHWIKASGKNGFPAENDPINSDAIENFLKQVEILQPNIVLLLGTRIYFDMYQKNEESLENRWIYYKEKQPIKNLLNYTVFIPHNGNGDCFNIPVVRFSHPSDRGKNAHPWHSPDSPYFNDIIKLVVKEVITNYDKYTQQIDKGIK